MNNEDANEVSLLWSSQTIDLPDRPLLDFVKDDEVDDFIKAVADNSDELSSLIGRLKRRKVAQRCFIHDTKKRKQRSGNKLKMVLDWLRLEPYCDSEIMSLVLGIDAPGAHKSLNKFTDQGWLVRDEVLSIGATREKHIFGVSSKGLYHLMDFDAVEPGPNRDFKRGQANPKTADHILGIQLVRLFHQRLENPDNEVRRYRAARDLPNTGKKHYRWETYPDAVIDGSPVRRILDRGESWISNSAIAVEVELHNKGSKRYKELVRAHLSNIAQERYDMVIYYLPDSDQEGNLRKTFEKIIEERTDDDNLDVQMSRFQFDSIEGLAGRIRTLR